MAQSRHDHYIRRKLAMVPNESDPNPTEGWDPLGNDPTHGASTQWESVERVLLDILTEWAHHGGNQDLQLEHVDHASPSGEQAFIQICSFDTDDKSHVELHTRPDPDLPLELLGGLEHNGSLLSAYDTPLTTVARTTRTLMSHWASTPDKFTVEYQDKAGGGGAGTVGLVALEQVRDALLRSRPDRPRPTPVVRQSTSARSATRPVPKLVRTARDAEENACTWMRWLGHENAQLTPIGADAGIDVDSSHAVAQVKMEGVPTGRPAVQALYGVATGEGKQGLFFSLAGYTAQAVQWADPVRLPLFIFDLQGSPEPANETALALLAAATVR